MADQPTKYYRVKVRQGSVVFRLDSKGEPMGKWYGGDVIELTYDELVKNRPRVMRWDEKIKDYNPDPGFTIPKPSSKPKKTSGGKPSPNVDDRMVETSVKG